MVSKKLSTFFIARGGCPGGKIEKVAPFPSADDVYCTVLLYRRVSGVFSISLLVFFRIS